MNGFPGPTLVATRDGSYAIGNLKETYGLRWSPDETTYTLGQVIDLGQTRILYEIETWFDGGCRDCIHVKNHGWIIRCGETQKFLLKGGASWIAKDLVPGIRLRQTGRDCGYEAVKSVKRIGLREPVNLYSMSGENFGLASSKTEHKLIVRGIDALMG